MKYTFLVLFALLAPLVAAERSVVYPFDVTLGGIKAEIANRALIDDYRGQGGRSRLAFEDADAVRPVPIPRKKSATPSRQARHLAG